MEFFLCLINFRRNYNIGPSSLKRAQLVPQVFKMSNISPFTNYH